MTKHRMQFEFGWAIEVEASRVSIYASLEGAITLTTEQSYDLGVWLIRELDIYGRPQAWRASDQVRIDALELELARAKRRAEWYRDGYALLLEEHPELLSEVLEFRRKK